MLAHWPMLGPWKLIKECSLNMPHWKKVHEIAFYWELCYIDNIDLIWFECLLLTQVLHVCFLSSRWLTGFVWRCRTTWTLWGTRRQTSSWRTSGRQRASSKMPGTLKRWGGHTLNEKVYGDQLSRIFLHPFFCFIYPTCVLVPLSTTAAPKSLPPWIGCQRGSEQFVSGTHPGETGVHGWGGDKCHGPAATGRVRAKYNDES